jgi:hypothetical protein
LELGVIVSYGRESRVIQIGGASAARPARGTRRCRGACSSTDTPSRGAHGWRRARRRSASATAGRSWVSLRAARPQVRDADGAASVDVAGAENVFSSLRRSHASPHQAVYPSEDDGCSPSRM